MRGLAKISTAVLGLLFVIGAIALLSFYSSDKMVELRAFERKFASVDIGDPETKVLALLGRPDAKESTFRIGQKGGHEDSYARAAASGSAYYLVWEKGVDIVFSVGVDSKGKVRAKEYGGT